MSSTTNPTSSASPSSTSRPVQQVEIPPTTVFSIGLGFVGLIVLLLSFTVITRVYRTRKRMAASAAAGRPITFRQAWQRDGGLFGFLSNIGNSNMAVGGGASAFRGSDRIWGAYEPEKARPILWDVPVREKESGSAKEDFEPFALSSTIPPRYIDRTTPAIDLPRPKITFSILISLPNQTSSSNPTDTRPKSSVGDDEEEWAELPELVIGTTQVKPIVYDEAAPERAEEIRAGNAIGVSSERDTEKAEVIHNSREGRPAMWERYDVIKWRIEGMR